MTLLAACRQEPSPTGVELLPGEDLEGIESFDTRGAGAAVSTETWFSPIPAPSSQFLHLGSTGGYNSRIAIRWLSLPADIAGGGRIISAGVTLYRAPYRFGDTTAPFSITARDVQSSWSSWTLTSDSLKNLSLAPNPVGSYSGPAKDSVEIGIDTTLVRGWLTKVNAGKHSEIYGLLLEAAAATDAVYAFEAVEAYNRTPVLRIVMSLNEGGDTTIYGSTLEDTYVVTGPGPSAAGLAVHGGLAWRGRIAFDLSAIPAGSIVNSAVLTLTADPSLRRDHTRGIDSVWVYQLLDETEKKLGSERMLTTAMDSGRHNAGGLVVTRMVQRWVNRTQANYGFALVKIEESSDLDGIGFYAADAEAGLRPRLTVTYTKNP